MSLISSALGLSYKLLTLVRFSILYTFIMLTHQKMILCLYRYPKDKIINCSFRSDIIEFFHKLELKFYINLKNNDVIHSTPNVIFHLSTL